VTHLRDAGELRRDGCSSARRTSSGAEDATIDAVLDHGGRHGTVAELVEQSFGGRRGA
jgi:hypothetical protein